MFTCYAGLWRSRSRLTSSRGIIYEWHHLYWCTRLPQSSARGSHRKRCSSCLCTFTSRARSWLGPFCRHFAPSRATLKSSKRLTDACKTEAGKGYPHRHNSRKELLHSSRRYWGRHHHWSRTRRNVGEIRANCLSRHGWIESVVRRNCLAAKSAAGGR